VIDPREIKQTSGAEKPTAPVKKRTRRVLLVDASSALKPALELCQAEHGSVSVVYAKTFGEARKLVASPTPIDLVILPQQSTEGSGLDLARELKQRDAATTAIVLTTKPDFELAQQAMHAGVSDIIVLPNPVDDAAAWIAHTTDRVRIALDKQWTERLRSARIRKLKRLCRRLNDARLEVTDQVDVLCNDLVTAYQELAVQVQNISHSAGYKEAVGEELDLEAVLRKTLEYIVQQAGPCNAAVFLPSSADEFSLGGYVNYDCTKASADMLLEHLADVLAPNIAKRGDDLLHATDNQQLDDLLGDDWNYLADCHLLALPVNHDGEALAVLTLFRDADQPFTESAIETLAMIADQMGTLLGRIIRVHHRAMPGFDDDVTPGNSDTYLPPSEWQGYNGLADPFDDECEDEDSGDMSF